MNDKRGNRELLVVLKQGTPGCATFPRRVLLPGCFFFD